MKQQALAAAASLAEVLHLKRQKKRARRTRRIKRSVRLIVGIPLGLAVLVLIIMRSPVVGWALKSNVRELTGCDIEISGAFVSLDGRLVVRDFVLLAPGVPGEAARVLTARRAAIDIDWSRVLLADVRVEGLRLDEPEVVISQSKADGSINIAALRAAAPAGEGKGLLELPSVDITRGRIVLGEHDASGDIAVLKTVSIEGQLMPRGDRDGAYTILMQEMGAKGLLTDGWLDLSSGSAQIKLMNFALDPWKGENIPTAYRDLWNRLGIEGKIASTTLSFDAINGARVTSVLDGVSMHALLPSDKPGLEKPADLALLDVRGTVSFGRTGLEADLTGVLEGQQGKSRLELKTDGLKANSAVTATLSAKRVSLTKDPEFLPYIPPRAREYFEAFRGPTGELDIRITIERAAGEGDKPGAISVRNGRVTLTNGTAAFHRFPYPFTEIDGVFEFTDQELRIVGVEGKGPTSARMTTSGIIAPLTDESMIDISVEAVNVPVDDVLMEAMPADKRRVVEQIFHRPSYERLVSAGVIRAPMVAAGAEVGPQPPEFMLAGPAKINVRIYSPKGRGAGWYTTIDVGFDEAGVVARAMPVPVIAKNLKVRVTDNDAKVLSAELQPIGGGSLDISAFIVFRENDAPVIKPDVTITAKDVPVDRFIMSALDVVDARMGATGRLDVVKDLRPSGLVGATVKLLPPSAETAAKPLAPGEPPDIEYDVRVDLSKATLSPMAQGHETGATVVLSAGELGLTKQRLTIAGAKGDVWSEGAAAGAVTMSGEMMLEASGPSSEGALSGTMQFAGLDLSRPLEKVVGVFAPESSRKLEELRAARTPRGLVTGSATLTRRAGVGESAKPPAIDLHVERAEDVSVALLNGRLGVNWAGAGAEDHRGGLRATIPESGPMRVRADELNVATAFNGQASGSVGLAGGFGVDIDAGRVVGPSELAARFDGWAFESPVIVPMLDRVAGPETSKRYGDLKPAGVLDATVRLQGESEAGPLTLSAELRPRSLGFTLDDVRVDIPAVRGEITLRTGGIGGSSAAAGAGEAGGDIHGTFVGLEAVTDAWTIRTDGDWRVRPDTDVSGPSGERAVDLSLAITASVAEVNPALRVILPSQVGSAIDELEIKLPRAVQVREGRLELAFGSSDKPTTFGGVLAFDDLKFNVGLPITDAAGTMRLSLSDPAGDAPTQFRMELEAQRLTAAGIRLGASRAVVASTDAPGELLIEPLEAKLHGGCMTGIARVRLPGDRVNADGGPASPSYNLDMVMTGVHLAPVLADAAIDGDLEGPRPQYGPDLDSSRGEIDARLTLSGVAGDATKRTGEGALRISDGDVLRMPLVLHLIQLSNFQIPSSDRLSYVQATFRVAGERAVFDEIAVLSNSVSILGSGVVHVPDMTVDMRFNSRGNVRVPLISDVFEALRNEIITTRITGKIADPKVSSEPLTGTRQLLEGIFVSDDPTLLPPPPRSSVDPKREAERGRPTTGQESRAQQPTE